MADVFDSTEEKKAKIAEIANTQQKAILAQGKPSGIYWFFTSTGQPGKQQINYDALANAVFFTSSNRVCFYEKTLKNGGKQWQLLGNGDYKLSVQKNLYYHMVNLFLFYLLFPSLTKQINRHILVQR